MAKDPEADAPMGKIRRELSIQDQGTRLHKRKVVIIFLGLATALFISFLDVTSVTTAQPAMADELNAGDSISWIGTSYLVSTTSCQLIYGRLSDIFGRKALLISALLLLGVGDLLCGFAQTSTQLFVFRAFAGCGGGGINSVAMIIMSDVTSLRERGKWQGYIAGAVATGSAVGPFVGAAFAQNVTWRWVFWVVPPCTVVSALVCWRFIPLKPVTGSVREKLLKVDYLGSFLSLAGNLLILVAISGGGSSFTFDSPVFITLLIVGVLILVAFMLVEWRVSPLPVLPVRLFTYRTPTVMVPVNIFFGFVYYANTYFLPRYYQQVLGKSETMSAVLLFPLLLIQTFASVSNGQITMRTGGVKPQILVGFAIWTIGSGLQTMFSRTTSAGMIVGFLLIQGWGAGSTFQTTLVAAQASAPGKDRAVVTSARNFFRFGGGAFGLAISNVIFNNVVQAALPKSLPAELRASVLQEGTVSLPSSVDAATREAVYDSLQKGMHTVFITFVPLIGACFLLCLLIQDHGLPDFNKAPEKAGGEKQAPADEGAEGTDPTDAAALDDNASEQTRCGGKHGDKSPAEAREARPSAEETQVARRRESRDR